MWKVDFQVRRHTQKINSVDVSYDMRTILTASDDTTFCIVDRLEKDVEIVQGHEQPINDIKFIPNQTKFLTASNDCLVKLWDFDRKSLDFVFKSHKQPVTKVDCFDDNVMFVSGSHDGTATIWDMECRERVFILNALTGWVKDVKTYDNIIAVAGYDRSVPLFDRRTGKVVQRLQTNTEADLYCLSFHHTGVCIGTGSLDHKVRVWDLRTNDIIIRQRAHSDTITSINFHPYSDDYMTTSKDCIARIWSLKSPEVIAAFRQHDAAITASRWYSDGKHFITVGEDRKICGFYQSEENFETYDGGDMLSTLETMRNQLEGLTNTMKKIDDRLVIQEDKIRLLKDINEPIYNASLKAVKNIKVGKTKKTK